MPKQQTAKAIPTDMREWVREVIGNQKFIDDLLNKVKDDGTGWRSKQLTYYLKRINDLLHIPPIIPSKTAWKKMLECHKNVNP